MVLHTCTMRHLVFIFEDEYYLKGGAEKNLESLLVEKNSFLFYSDDHTLHGERRLTVEFPDFRSAGAYF